MSLLPAFAVVTLVVAAVMSASSPWRSPPPAVRGLAGLAALAVILSLESPGAWPWAAVVVGAAVFATPLACLFGAAAAALVLLSPPGLPAAVLSVRLLAGAAVATAAAALDAELNADLREGWDVAWPATAAAWGLCLTCALSGRGQVLLWRVGLEPVGQGVNLAGAGLLLGLTLLVGLAGALALTAHLLTPAVPSLPVRRFGRRALVLAFGLAVVSLGHLFFLALGFPRMLSAGAGFVSAVVFFTGLLAAGLAVQLADAKPAEPGRLRASALRFVRVAAGLAFAAAAAAGFEGWRRQGGYVTSLTSAAMSAALFGLAALEATRFGILRRVLFLSALVYLIV